MKEYKFKINGKDYAVAIGEAEGQMLSVNVNGADYQVELEDSFVAAAPQNDKVAAAPQNDKVAAAPQNDKVAAAPQDKTAPSASSVIPSASSVIPSAAKESAAPAAAPAAKPAGPGTKVESPLPGVVIEVSVKEGQAVKQGQKVAVLEAMKMENEIAATVDGTVTAIHVNKGDSVLEGAPIVTIA